MVPPAFAPPPSAPPPNSMGEVRLPTQIPISNLGEEGGGLGGRCNGRSRPSYNMSHSKRDLLLRGQPDEVDFTVSPTISH